MNRVLIALLLMGTLAASSVAKESKAPYTIMIAAKNSTVKTGQDVEIEVTRHNTSSTIINCGAAYDQNLGVDISLEYLVLDGSGAKVEKKAQNGRSLVDSKPCTLPPGETVSSGGGRITGMYDLTKPGYYTVQVLERIFDKNNKVIGWVKSNVIRVTVTE